MKIKVKQKDIDAGVPNNALYCPLAIAIKRARLWNWKFGRVIVGRDDVTVLDSSSLKVIETYTLPPEARHFRFKFDKGLPVKPIEFTL